MITTIYKGVDNQEEITREIKIPSSKTKLRKYFDILYSNNKGDNCNPGLKIAFDIQKKDSKEEEEYKLRQNGIYLCKRLVQHG